MPDTIDSRLKLERYKIIHTRSSKCWVYLHIDDGGSFQLHKADINTGLVSLIEGNEIEVIRKRDPDGTVYIAAILYNNEFLYPKKNNVETRKYHRTGLL